MHTTSFETSSPTQRWAYGLAAGWLLAVLCGLVWLARYANTPADTAEPQSTWPTNSQIALNTKLSTLVIFAHPHCPCTRASIAELAKIAAKAPGRFAGSVALFKPSDSDDAWEQTDLAKSAEAIPGVHLVVDRDGQLARQFHITTSGHTLLYSPAGKLLFSGGITDSRGHEGDNAGESAVASLLLGQPTDLSRTPVFGCPIVEDQ